MLGAATSASADLPVTGNTTQTRPENRAFYPALDGVRAAAFFLVFATHFLSLPWGWAGVDIFFVLSGFLITGILFDSRDDLYRARNFYVRRSLRIFPLYYGILLAFLLLQPVAHWLISWSWLVWPAYLGNFAAFAHPYAAGSAFERLAELRLVHAPGVAKHFPTVYMGHFWSLCIEEQFYLLWPWVVFRVRDRRTLAIVCAASVPLVLGARLIGAHALPSWMVAKEVLYRATPFRLDSLLLGGLLALLLRGPNRERVLRLGRLLFWPCWLLALVWAYGFPFLRDFQHQPQLSWLFTFGITAVDILSALLILVAVQPENVVSRFFSQRPLRWVGRISYGAYVFHDMPHALYRQTGARLLPQHPKLGASVLAMAGTLLFAWLSFRFFESRFINLKERWTRPGRRMAPHQRV